MTTKQNIFEESGLPHVNYDNESQQITPANEPDSLFIYLITRVAKRYGLTYEQLQRQSDSYTCISKHCLAYFFYINLGLTTKRTARLIYGHESCHPNISWLTGRKMGRWLKERSEYRFCYEDIKIIWKEIEDRDREEKGKPKEDYTELMNILNN